MYTNAYYQVDSQNDWDGSCYGMSVLAILFYQKEQGGGSFPTIQSFQGAAKKISDLRTQNASSVKINGKSITFTLTELIEALHITQKSFNIKIIGTSTAN